MSTDDQHLAEYNPENSEEFPEVGVIDQRTIEFLDDELIVSGLPCHLSTSAWSYPEPLSRQLLCRHSRRPL